MENEGRLAAGGPGMPGGFWPRIGAGISRQSGGGGGAGDDPRHLAPDGGWGVPPDGRGGGSEEARQLARGYSFRIKRIPPRAPQEKFTGGCRRRKLHILRRCPLGTGSLIPLLLLFPPQTLRLLCGGSPIFPPVTPLKRPKGRGRGPLPLESRPGDRVRAGTEPRPYTVTGSFCGGPMWASAPTEGTGADCRVGLRPPCNDRGFLSFRGAKRRGNPFLPNRVQFPTR